MTKEYKITFFNLDTGKEKSDTFTSKTVSEAKGAFRECYRHGMYKITKVEVIAE